MNSFRIYKMESVIWGNFNLFLATIENFNFNLFKV